MKNSIKYIYFTLGLSAIPLFVRIIASFISLQSINILIPNIFLAPSISICFYNVIIVDTLNSSNIAENFKMRLFCAVFLLISGILQVSSILEEKNNYVDGRNIMFGSFVMFIVVIYYSYKIVYKNFKLAEKIGIY